MRRYLFTAMCLVMGLAAVLPLLHVSFGEFMPWLSFNLLAGTNLLAWSLVLIYTFSRRELRTSLDRIAKSLGISTRFKSLDALLDNVVRELGRKNNSFSMNLLEQKISTKEELSRTLERVVGVAYRLFSAESAELALFDKASGLYHSAFVMGTPMRTSSQAMLSGAAEGGEAPSRPDVMVQPLAFAGSILGTIRVALKNGTTPSLVDQEIMRLLAMQGSLALINAQYTSELMRMKRSSDESLKAKTGFLANLSHEIRAPLGIMMNAVELVLDGLCGPVSQDQIETLKMIHTNGEHLLELINDVLDYAKVEAGKIQPQKVDILINDLLRDVCNVVRAQADAKRHRLHCKNPGEVLAFSCDRRHARQMLINLLTNAIKYTPDGGQIEVWAERAPGNKVRMHVKDSGVGIEESERDRVFAPFERVENSYSLNQMGTGLGMSLTRKLAGVNGGTVDFTSIPGQGSDFWLSFAAVEEGFEMAQENEAPKTAAKGRGEVILLVEKEDGERNMMARYLAYNGYKVAAAGGRAEALEIFRTRKVDLAVIDNNCVDESNEDIVRSIRSQVNGSTLPIILVSSRAFIFDIEKYLRSGIDRCLVKPVKLSELGEICRKLLDGEFTGEVIDEFDKASAQKPRKEDSKPKKNAVQTQVISLDDVSH